MTPQNLLPDQREAPWGTTQRPQASEGTASEVTETAGADWTLQYYAAIIESSDDAIIGETVDGIITSWNPGAERMFGYRASDIIGRSIELLIPPDRAGEETEILRHTRCGEYTRNLETVRQCQDGRSIDVSVTVSPIIDGYGRVIGAAKVVRDITARKQTEQLMAGALQEIMHLKLALDEHAIVAITDLNGEITYVNEKFCAISKYSQAELVGQSHRIVQSNHHTKEYLQDLWRTTSEGRVWKGELRDRAKDGSTYWTQATIVPFPGPDGRPQQYVAIRTDISEQKMATEALLARSQELERAKVEYRAQAELLRWVFDSMGDGVVVAAEDGKIILLNPVAEQLMGTGRVGMSHRQWAQDCGMFLPDMTTPYPPEDLPLSRAIRGEDVDRALVFVRGGTPGQERWLTVTTRPLHEGNQTGNGGVMVLRDISEVKRAEKAAEAAREAEAANRAKNEFLSRMSHELRTPLNAILGFAQILEYGDLDPEQLESVEQIGKAGRHLLKLVNHVLDISRIEAGRLALSVEPVLAGEAVEATISLIEPVAKQMNIAVTVQPSAHWKECILADRPRLLQVLLNLLSNAIKFNRERGQVTVDCERADSGRLRVAVRDTGMGIPADKTHLLFRPFERLEAEAAGIEGVGIGLALSKRLVEAMRGELGVETEGGKGSTFWVDFPTCECPLEGNRALLETHKSPAASPGAPVKTILYVEDNPSNSVLMDRIVANRPDLRLLSAAQGRLGLELARLHQPQLILLDLHLPDLPGEEVLRLLQADHDTAHIPVAVITADAMPSRISRSLVAGAQACFTKPVDVKSLLQFFDQTLSLPEVTKRDGD